MSSSQGAGAEYEHSVTRRRRISAKSPAVLPALIAFAMLAFITFLYSPTMDVKDIEVSGNLYFSSAEVTALARVPVDRNMLLINTGSIEDRLLKAPRIESAKVVKRYPTKIEISVVERRTIAFLPYGGFFTHLDDEGLAIGVSEAITDPNVPIITGIVPTFAVLGEKVRPMGQIVMACKIGRILSEKAVPNISEVNVKDMQDIAIITNEGSRILLGASDGIEDRLAMAIDILSGARARKQAFKYIDVRIADKPVLGTR